MYEFSLRFDASDIDAKTPLLSRALVDHGKLALQVAANDVIQSITSGRYYVNRSNKTSASFGLVPVGELGMSVRSRSKIALIIDQGSKPHIIRPKAGAGFIGPLPQSQTRGRRKTPRRFLAFTIGGRLIFRRQVNHPGTKAKHFVQAEEQRLEGELLPPLVDAAASRAINDAGLG